MDTGISIGNIGNINRKYYTGWTREREMIEEAKTDSGRSMCDKIGELTVI